MSLPVEFYFDKKCIGGFGLVVVISTCVEVMSLPVEFYFDKKCIGGFGLFVVISTCVEVMYKYQ